MRKLINTVVGFICIVGFCFMLIVAVGIPIYLLIEWLQG